MSATEALQLQVDNLRHQLHQLQVENEKLRSEVSKGQGDDTADIEQLRGEASELRQLLHDAQEREVSGNELLNESRTEYNELKFEYDEVLNEREELRNELTDYRARYEQTCEELRRVRENAESERYRALDEERVKWERREAMLYAHIEKVRTSSTSATSTGTPLMDTSPLCDTSATAAVSSVPSHMASLTSSPEIPRVSDVDASSSTVAGDLRATAPVFSPVTITCPSGGTSSSPMYTSLASQPTEVFPTGGGLPIASTGSVFPSLSVPLRSGLSMGVPVHTTAVFPSPLTAFTTRFPTNVPPVPLVHPAASQLPPISKFRGEDPDQEGGNFEEWIEQFESIAEAYGWDPKTRLVNLTTRLQGQAYSFYRTCSPEQRANYTSLKSQLMTRFTPVRLQAVHSNLFHQRKQEDTETVDQYAQDLRKLFYRAYPRASQATEAAEGLGRSVLAYQFVAGLKKNLQSKVAGVEGDFDQLLLRARFEEAKIRDLSSQSDKRQGSGTSPHSGLRRTTPAGQQGRTTAGSRPNSREGSDRCYTCRGVGHFAKNCPYKGRSAPTESQGKSSHQGRSNGHHRPGTATTANLQGGNVPDSTQQAKDKVTKLREELRAAELEVSLAENIVTTNVLHGSRSQDATGSTTGERDSEVLLQGPIVEAEICLEGHPAVALIDTGSPISIVSIDFLLQILNRNRPEDTSKEDWASSVKDRLQPPRMTVRNFGGGEVNVICQCTVSLTCGEHKCDATVLVQKGVSQGVLLGTDVLKKLGFRMLTPDVKGSAKDLLGTGDWQLQSVPQAEKPNPVTVEQVATVHLLQTCRIPARHCRLVPVKAIGSVARELMLFYPTEEVMRNSGTTPAVCVTNVEGDGKVILSVENHSLHPVTLKQGEVLGTLEPVHEITTVGTVNNIMTEQEPQKPTVEPGKRGEQLYSKLNIEDTLSVQELDQLRAVVSSFSDVFAMDQSELGRTDLIKHSIDTGGQGPVKQLPYRTPFSLRGKMEEMISQMLEQGVIKPSNSPWASPVVLVAKKDGTSRFCVDYRRLNSVTKMDTFPLPRIDDSLDLLANTAYFTTLDLASGYWQVEMDSGSREKTTFCSHSGLYEFNVMPFGLCNAPATFQRLMEAVLVGLAREKCVVYLDDILVMGKTFEEHLDNLAQVLSRLRQAGLKLKPKKCHLAKRRVCYLGYVVSSEGISADPAKVEAVKNFATPADVRQLRSFLGLASYYRRFIPAFSKVATPLFALTRKDALFRWDEQCQKSFDHLKDLLIQAPLLVFPDFAKPFVLETDASGQGLGAVLGQQQESGLVAPIAYASRTLQKHEQNYGVTELEALGVVWAIRHFRPYLYGHACKVYTDHEALKSLLNTPHPSGKLARWGLAIQELDLEIHYRPGRSNQAADALSRPAISNDGLLGAPVQAKDGEETIHRLTTTGDEDADGLASRQDSDGELKVIKQYLLDNKLPDQEEKARELTLNKAQYEVIDNVLYHIEPDKTLRIVPPTADRKGLFETAHGGVLGGHLRTAKMHSQPSRQYWWPRMRADIVEWTKACQICATRNVGKPLHPPLTPIPVAGPFDRVGVDVIRFPPSQRGNKYAIVFVDYLTKWPEVFPAKDQSALTIARLLVEKVVTRHGVPTQLLSDRGASFLSNLMKSVYELLGLKKVNTTAYHPQTDGLVERFNRTLTDMLSKKVKKGGKDWDQQLPYVLFAYRASIQESTGESPFFVLYGRTPRVPTDGMLQPPIDRSLIDLDDYCSEITTRMSAAWESARQHIKASQGKQKRFHDRKCKDPKISVGDKVMVYFPSERLGKAYKFSRPFRGPYQVDRVFPNGAEVTSLGGDKRRTIRIALDRVRHCPKELSDHLDEDSIFDGLEKLCEDDPIASEAACTGSQSSPPPSRNTEAEPEKEKPETRRVRRSKRTRRKRLMS